MVEYYTILIAFFVPDLTVMAALLRGGELRKWWIRLVEDSDGDPHHTDGRFILTMFAALSMIRIGLIAGLRQIYFHQHLVEVAITFVTTGSALLGVQLIVRPRLASPIDEQKTLKENV